MSMIEVTDVEKRIAERVDSTIAGALEVSRHAGGLAFTNAGEAMEFAKMMAVSQIGVRKHLRGNVGACLAITVQSIEWGMSPFAVANKSYMVNDQLAFESQLIQAVILKRAPIKGRFKVEYLGEGAKRKCKVSATLRDTGETVEYVSPEFEKITPKNSPLWKTDPDQQQFYYSGRALCRRHFPDVLLGVYDADELPQEVSHGPAHARDITPKTLAGRLDAIAVTMPDEHDPETGEILDETGADASLAPEAAAGEGERPHADAATADPEDPFDGKSMAYRQGWEDGTKHKQRPATSPAYLGDDEVEAYFSGFDAAQAVKKAARK